MEINPIIEAIAAGLIQGATELLPVSSSGHLLLFSQITGLQLVVSEISVIHLGTVIAMAVVMRDKIKAYFRPDMLVRIAISIIPAGIVGFLFESTIDEHLAVTSVIAASLIFWGIVMIVVDALKARIKFSTHDPEKITIKQATIVGLAQVLALIPGTSRSGVTTIAGIVSGVSPEASVDFSFLSGIPLISITACYGIFKLLAGETGITADLTQMLLATAVALGSGLIAAILYKKFITKRIFTIAGIYRIILGILVLLA